MESRSDGWRGVRHQNEVQETAYITKAVSDYCRVAAGENVQVTWQGMPLEKGIAATNLQTKQVTLNGGLLDGQKAPFTGAFVDQLTGLAAHEAGHLLLLQQCRNPEHRDFMPTALGAVVWNIIEDMAIDGRPMAEYNAVFGELTRGVRENGELAQSQREALIQRWESPEPLASPEDLANLWGCSHLFRCRDAFTPLPHRQAELAVMQQLDPWAQKVMNSTTPLSEMGNQVLNAVHGVMAVLQKFQPTPQSGGGQEGQGSPQSGQSQGKGSGKAGSKDQGSGGGEPEQEKAEDGSSESSQGEDEGGEDSPGESTDSKESGDKQGEGDGKSDSSSGEQDSGEAGEGGGGEGQGSGAGEASGIYKPTVPTVCLNDSAKQTLTAKVKNFLKEVQQELKRIEMEQLLRDGGRDAAKMLAPYIDRKTVNAIERAYQELASQPSRRKHEESGRIDRRRLVFAGQRSDVFTQQNDRKLEGTLVLLLDLSGSTASYEHLIKQTAANVYTALKRGGIQCHIFTYGDAIVKVADPIKVIDFRTFGSAGGTPTGPAFTRVLSEVSPKGESVILHVTDGQPNGSPEGQMAQAVKDGWKVVNIGVGFGFGSSTYFGQPLELLRSYEELPAIVKRIVKHIVKTGRGL